jgi:hypothetical protein
VKRIREFFKAFESLDFKDLSEQHIQRLVNTHKLSVTDLVTDYSKKLKNLR